MIYQVPQVPLPLAQSPGTTDQVKLLINECYGPVIQGEGPEIGLPCMFLRLHACNVNCPGCDTAYTWDGSEKGKWVDPDLLGVLVVHSLKEHPGCGLVVSGGEPLVQYKNPQLSRLLSNLAPHCRWVGLETSGFTARPLAPDDYSFQVFCNFFNSICISPKVTDCLHGAHSDDELLANIPTLLLMRDANGQPLRNRITFKFVVKTPEDVEKVVAIDRQYSIQGSGCPILLMPYGVHRQEIIDTIESLIPISAKYGLRITPRLHSIIWGKVRGT